MKKATCLIMFVLLIGIALADDIYNTSNLDSSENLYDYTKSANDLVDGLIGFGILLIAFIIPTAMILNTNGGVFYAASIGGFFASITGIILLPLQLIEGHIIGYVIALTGVFFFLSYVFKGGSNI